ncbi:unnamed protein product [Diamesa tonsa]
MLAFIKRLSGGQESSNLNTSLIPVVIESCVETTTVILNINGCSSLNDKIKFEQRTDNNTENEQMFIRQNPYILFEKSTEHFNPNDIGDLTELATCNDLSIIDALKFVDILFTDAIKNSERAASYVGVIKLQQKFIKDHFLMLCTNLVVKLRKDFITKNINDLDQEYKQGKSVGILIGELFNQDLLTWQNIEAHWRRLMANDYNSAGAINIIKIIIHTCGNKLKESMPAGCFQSLHKTFEDNNVQISKSNAVSINNIPQQTSLEKSIEHQPDTRKEKKSTYADFEKIIIQQKPSYENIINHLNSVNINKNLDKYVNLFLSEIMKKPTMTKTYTNVLNEMKLKIKKQEVMELTLYNSLQFELAMYLIISNCNLKKERPEMQLKAQILGNLIGELHKNDLIDSLKIEGVFNELLKKQRGEGHLELVYNIIQSCGSELQITLGTKKMNNYIFQLKINTNPLNMSPSICTKVNSIKNYRETNNNSSKQPSISPLKDKQNSNAIIVQTSIPQSNTANTSTELSNTDELLKKLKRLQEFNDGEDSTRNKDLLNAYNEQNQTPVNNMKLSLNYANAIDHLSLENFEDIKGQLISLEINTSEKVNVFVDSILTRILKGSEIDVMGAKMCHELYLISTNSIQAMILKRVDYLLEIHSLLFKNNLRILRSGNNNATALDHVNCYTKFIEEFFKVDLLAVNYVHTHLQRLLDSNYISESSVFLASALLLSCGTELYNKKFQLNVLKKFVEYVEGFCQKNITHTELRMNLKKILELQQNNWQIIKKTTTVNNAINNNQQSTIIPREIINDQVELPQINEQSTADESSDEIIKALLSDPSSTTKYVQKVTKMNDKGRIRLLIMKCGEEIENCLNTVSLYTGKDELLELISSIQYEKDSQKRKELKVILDCRLDAPKNAIIIVKFIGELYNFDLFDIDGTLVLISYFLDYDNINEYSIVCLCEFLLTIGSKFISNEQGLEMYQKYSKNLNGISKNQAFNMPLHVKNLIEDVVKLI